MRRNFMFLNFQRI